MLSSTRKTYCADDHACDNNAVSSCCAFSDIDIIMGIAVIAVSIFLMLRLDLLVLILIVGIVALLIIEAPFASTERKPLFQTLPAAA